MQESVQNLVRQLLEAGKLAEAEAEIYQSLRSEPEDAESFSLLGQIARRQDQLSDASVMFRRAVDLNPLSVADWERLAEVLFSKNEFEASLEAAEHASSVFKGRLLMRLSRFAEAAGVFQQEPDNPAALEGLGNAERVLGNTSAALSAYKSWVEREPDNGEAWWSLANLKTYQFSDAELSSMQAAPETEALHFALGEANEQKTAFEQAFYHYQRANRMRRDREDYDASRHRELMARLSSFAWPKGTLSRKTPVPIFVVGLPRSGTSLIEQILASHSEVEGLGELTHLGDLANELDQLAPGFPEGLGQQHLDDLGQQYLDRATIHGSGKRYFVDKLPNNFMLIGFIQSILPQAKIVHSIRHPVATCFSCYKQRFARGQPYSYDLTELADYHNQYQRLMQHWHESFPDLVLDMSYEMLVTEPEPQIRRLLNHCGLDWEDDCLAFHEAKRPVNTASSEQVRRPLYQDAVDQWRNFEPFLEELTTQLEYL